MAKQLKATLDMLAISELGPGLIANSDNGYNVLVGSTPQHPLLFDSYDDHPRILNSKLNSTAAGRYQIIWPTWKVLKLCLGLKDFGKLAQDYCAVELIRERKATDAALAGNITRFCELCCVEWASLPGGTSGQHQNSLEYLEQIFVSAGGQLNI